MNYAKDLLNVETNAVVFIYSCSYLFERLVPTH